jgi:chemotaxis protein CheX
MDATLNSSRERVEIQLSAKVARPASLAKAAPPAATTERACEGWHDLLMNATCEVFEVMVGSTLGRVTGRVPKVVADFTAMVGMAGSLCGMLSLRGPSESAKRIAANMLGVDDVSIGASVLDAFGEVCNMIAGSFKSRIPAVADGCSLSVPTVISGRDYSLHSLADGARLEVILNFEGSPISVTLDLHS